MNSFQAKDILDKYLSTKENISNISHIIPVPPFFGFTRGFLGSALEVHIGYNGYASPNLFTFSFVVDNSFIINSGLSISHENKHVIDSISYNSFNFDSVLFMSEVISTTNKKLYDLNYCSWPHEIAAELSALKSTKNDSFFKEFSEEEVNQAIIEREKFGLKQKGQCFHSKDNIDDAIAFLEKRDKNPIEFIQYRDYAYDIVHNEDGSIQNKYTGILQKYMFENKESILWKMKYDSMSYLIPFDFAFAVSINLSDRDDIKKFREKMKEPDFPLQFSDYTIETFEREWNIKLRENPNLIKEKAKELGLLKEPEPTSGGRFD